MTPSSDLLTLAELRERATAGPWGYQPSTREHKDAGVTAEGGGWIAASDNHNAPYIAAAGNLTPTRIRELAAMEAFIREVADDRYDRVSPGVKERARKLLPDGRPGTKLIEESPGDLAVRELRGPFAVMAGAPWNVLDSRGCRIACCGGDSNADRERYGPAIAAAIVAALNARAALTTKGPTNE